MTADTPASQPDGVELLRRAIDYTLGALRVVTPALLPRPTPCRAWDLGMLLRHVNESLAALHEGFDAGRIDLDPAPEDDSADPVHVLRARASRLLEACSGVDGRDSPITVGGCPLPASIMASAGALEIAVHGWDISQACGLRGAIPYPLAVDLLEIGPLVVTDATRDRLFAPPVTAAPQVTPSDRLVALLGRQHRP